MMYNRPNVFLSIILGLIFPALFIWAVNILFGLGVAFTFKTYLASLTLLLCLRFFTSKNTYTIDPWFDEFYDEEDAEEEEHKDDFDDNDKRSQDSTSGSHLRRVK